MPAWTALGWKSRTSLALALGRSSEAREQPATPRAATSARTSRGRGRCIGSQHGTGGGAEGAAARRTGGARVPMTVRRRVTFSRNVTLSLSRTCRCFCKYCAFATHRPHLYAPDEVERRLDDAARRGCKELLVLTGEKPEVNAEVARRLEEYGHADFTSYVVWT